MTTFAEGVASKLEEATYTDKEEVDGTAESGPLGETIDMVPEYTCENPMLPEITDTLVTENSETFLNVPVGTENSINAATLENAILTGKNVPVGRL